MKVMYLSPPTDESPVTSGLPLRLAVLSAFAGTAFFGIYPVPLLDLARTAAAALGL